MNAKQLSRNGEIPDPEQPELAGMHEDEIVFITKDDMAPVTVSAKKFSKTVRQALKVEASGKYAKGAV